MWEGDHSASGLMVTWLVDGLAGVRIDWELRMNYYWTSRSLLTAVSDGDVMKRERA